MADYTPPTITLTDTEVIDMGIAFGNRVGDGKIPPGYGPSLDIDSGLRDAMTDREFRTQTTGHEADTIVPAGP